MDVLMIVRSDVAHDARILREASTLAGAGHAVHVVGKDVPDGWTPPPGVTVESVGARSAFRRPAARRLPAHLRAARWLLLPHHNASVWASFLSQVEVAVAGQRPDVVHAHDFPVLPFAARLASDRGAALVYDAHEWWSGRLRVGRPTPLADRRQIAVERVLGGRADLVVTVSEPIADRFREWGWPRVAVVRNTFPGPAREPIARPAPAGLLYAGRIGEGRDLPAVLAAAADDGQAPGGAPLRWTLMGTRDETFLAGRQLPAGVELRPATAVDDVDDALRDEGLALVTLEDSCENHRLALPNKLFHAVRAGVPVVAADLPAMAGVVRRHGIGVLYRPGDAASLAAAAREAVARYPELLAAVTAVQADGALSWDHDAAVLRAAYAELQERRGATGRHGNGRAAGTVPQPGRTA